MLRKEDLPVDTEWFLERIKSRGLSMNRVAKLIGADPGNLCRVLHGQALLNIFHIEPLADILGVGVDVIIRKATRGLEEKRKRKSAG